MELNFQTPPDTLRLMARALVPKPALLRAGRTVPPMVATLPAQVPDAQHVQRYASLCGFAHTTTLPVTYPHVLAAPLHLALVTHAAFPLRALGVVHVRNRIRQHRALSGNEPLAVRVSVDGHTAADNGVEVTLVTDVMADGKPVWESWTTMLARNRARTPRAPGVFTPPDFSDHLAVATVTASEDVGRRYGVVAKDLNPIHLHALSARVFGFPRAIAHGMWTFARCVAELQGRAPMDAATLDVAFKRPLLLPGTAYLVATPPSPSQPRSFALHDGAVRTVFLTGTTVTG